MNKQMCSEDRNLLRLSQALLPIFLAHIIALVVRTSPHLSVTMRQLNLVKKNFFLF